MILSTSEFGWGDKECLPHWSLMSSRTANQFLSLSTVSSTGPGKEDVPRDFSGSPVVKTLHSQCRGMGLIPGQGTKILHATQHDQK